jgi:Mor family transcriptional regulator
VDNVRDENKLLKELNIDDLKEFHQDIANYIGLDSFIELSKNFGGSNIYIPKPFELYKKLMYRKIKEEFNGDNLHKLAIKYKLCDNSIYKIIKGDL